MKPKIQNWLLPATVLAILMLVYLPVGSDGTYGRVLYPHYGFFWERGGWSIIDYNRLVIQIVVATALCYCIAVMRQKDA